MYIRVGRGLDTGGGRVRHQGEGKVGHKKWEELGHWWGERFWTSEREGLDIREKG